MIVVSLALDTPFGSLPMPLPYVIKIFQTIYKLGCALEFGLEIRSGEITRKRTELELSFLHSTFLLDLICPYYISNYSKQYESYGLHKISEGRDFFSFLSESVIIPLKKL